MQNNFTRKYRELFSDSVAFFISNFASKILAFLLIPLYTSVLSTEDYGIADLLNNTVNVLYPLLTLCIMEATLRFAFEKKANKDAVLTNSLAIIALSIVVLCIATPLVKIISDTMYAYWGWFVAIFAAFNLHQVLTQYAKGIGKTKIFAISGVLHTVVIIVSNIMGLLVLKQGLNAYFISIVLGYFVASLYLVIFAKIRIKKISLDFSLLKEMLKFSIPTVPTVIAWWVNTSADKYIIIGYLGVAISGLYGVAYKIPSILTMVTNIFTSAWTLSAIKSVDDKDSAEYQSSVYKYFNIANVMACSVLILLSKSLARILFAKDFFEAWKCVPLLLVAYLFSGLSGFMASSFRARKKTQGLMISTIIGAVVNVLLNLVVIKEFGIMGAAATTVIGFAVTFYIRYINVKRIIDLKITLSKDTIVYIILTIQAILIGCEISYSYPISAVLLIVIVLIYNSEILYIEKQIVNMIKRVVKK